MRVGGQAEWLLEPADPQELREAWCAARERELPVRLLGGGANLVIDDGLHRGVTIATERMRRVFRPLSEDDTSPLENGEGREPVGRTAFDRETDPRLVAWCGASLPGMARISAALGWSGLEGLAGVPGSVGGGLAMNAGGRWGETWDRVTEVMLLTEQGELVLRPRAECSPSYRDGKLGSDVAVGCVFALEVDQRKVVQERVRDFVRDKNAVQPVRLRSAGCIFKNPDPELSDGRTAGQLVDQCGGKGLSRGDAIVSDLHGNFIINRGEARAADVLGLIEDVRALVEDRAGVSLEIEVRRWRSEPEPALEPGA